MIRRHCTHDYAPPHVPMVWTIWKNGTHPTLNPGAQFLLGYNEPNHADQAHLTPQAAAAFWPEVERLANGLPLVAPVTAGTNMHWLDQFIQHCQHCRFDYVAAHSYSCNADALMHYLQRLHNKYHRKVWLTEFGCAHTHDVNVLLNFMKQMLPRLEGAPYVYRLVKKKYILRTL